MLGIGGVPLFMYEGKHGINHHSVSIIKQTEQEKKYKNIV